MATTSTTDSPTPVVPTLHSISTPMLHTPADVATYLIHWLFLNPGNTLSVNENEAFSYRILASTYANDPEALASHISAALTVAIGHYFPNERYEAACTVEKQDKVSEEGIWQGNRVITIGIMDTNGVSIIPSANIIVDSTGDKFSIQYEQQRTRR